MKNKIRTIIEDNRFHVGMLFCISAYACLKFPYRAAADVFQTLFLLGFILCLIPKHRSLTQEPIFKIFLLALTFPLFSWIASKISIPDLAQSSPSLSDAIGLFYFLPIAYLVSKDRKGIYFIWLFFSLGLIASILHYSPDIFQDLSDALSGERVSFGFYNLQHASAWSGACIIIILGVLIKQISNRNYLLSFALVLSFIPFVFVFVSTQTRQTFLGLFVAFLCVAVIYAARFKINKSKALICLVAFSVISAITFNYSGIKERTLKESNTYVSILTGEYRDFDNAREGSTVRFALWYAGYQWVKERPLFGSGREISEHIIKESPYTEASRKSGFRHLHSYYMEILVSYGIYGLLIVLGLFACIYLNLLKRHASNHFDDVQFVGLTFIPYWLVVNIFEPHLLTSPGQLIHNVMIGTFFFVAYSRTTKVTN